MRNKSKLLNLDLSNKEIGAKSTLNKIRATKEEKQIIVLKNWEHKGKVYRELEKQIIALKNREYQGKVENQKSIKGDKTSGRNAKMGFRHRREKVILRSSTSRA